jgi:hypothetical protein
VNAAVTIAPVPNRARQLEEDRADVLVGAGDAGDQKALDAVAMRLARRGYDAAVILATMTRLATSAALTAIAWSEAEDEAIAAAEGRGQ